MYQINHLNLEQKIGLNEVINPENKTMSIVKLNSEL